MTNAQTVMLARLIQDGPQHPPGGYRGAHIDASGFYRTVDSLVRLGFVRWKSIIGGGTARITPEGREEFFRIMERRFSR
jgi:hypothetical protein